MKFDGYVKYTLVFLTIMSISILLLYFNYVLAQNIASSNDPKESYKEFKTGKYGNY